MSKSGGKQKIRVQLPMHLEAGGNRAVAAAGEAFDRQRAEGLPSQYVGISDQRQQALQQTQAIAQGGGGPGYQEWNKTVSGGYLESNPYIDQIVQNSIQDANRNAPDAFVGGGRFGGGSFANAVASNALRTSVGLRGANYDAERSRMMGALGMGSEYAYQPQRVLAGVGSEYEADTAAQQQEALRQYAEPSRQVAEYTANLSANPLNAALRTDVSQRTPFDWTAAIGGMLNPSSGLMGGGGKG